MFVCLGFGHFILFVYFFPWTRRSKGPQMGRQFFKNVALPTPLRGCRSLLEIVFCRTKFGHGRSSKGPGMGRQFFKNVDFSVTYPLKGV